MADLVGHEACPRCREEGRDRSGDNLARYSNGSAWCFACHYIEKPTKYRPPEHKEAEKPPNDLTLNFATENLLWLRKFLSPSEIADHFRYSPALQRHVFQSGEFWEARSVKPGVQKKSIQHGSKPFIVLGEAATKDSPIVIVEDIVSAIKVARHTMAIPLFGSDFRPEWMIKVAKMQPKRVVIWLDFDKAMDAREITRKFNLLLPVARALSTINDPKAVEDEDIKRYLQIEEHG